MVRLAAVLGVGIVAAGLGIWRILPGVGFWDTAEFQTVPPILGTAHPTGYPTYVLLGWAASALLTPIGEAALRMNVLSALVVGVAAGIAVDLVRRLTRSLALGVAAGIALATTPIAWAIATHADPHALHLAFAAGLIWLLVRWEDAVRSDDERADRWLLGAAAVTGLAVGNHSLTLLLGLPIVLFVAAVAPRTFTRPRLLAAAAAAFAVPLVLVYLELPLRSGVWPAPLVYGTPHTWEGFWYVALGEQFRGGIGDPFGDLAGKVGDLVELAGRELGALVALVPIAFAAAVIRRPRYALLTGTALLITVFFNAAYVNADIDRYYLGPALIAWTWLAILAGAVVDAVATIALEPAGLPADDRAVDSRSVRGPGRGSWRRAAAALLAVALLVPTIGVFGARAAAVDRTRDRTAELWLDEVLTLVEPDAVIVSWWSYSTPLWYAQHIQGRRLDISVVDDRTRLDQHLGDVDDVIEESLGRRPVYLIRIDLTELRGLRERYRLEPLPSSAAANVQRVVERIAPAGSGG